MTAEPVTATVDPRTRPMGAIVGGVLGAVAAAAVYLVTLVPAVSEFWIVALLAGSESSLAQIGAWSAMVWLTAPIAAALTGWTMAPRALADDAWSGLGMGLATYFVAVTIGPFAVLGPVLFVAGATGAGPAPIEVILATIMGAVMYAMLGAVLLFPLLGVTALFGIAWARVLRGVVAASGAIALTRPSRPLPIGSMVATAAVLGVMWLGATLILAALGQSEVWID
ncbi:MAG: hypothetical protein ABIQ58_01850 [Candidatus Limnocylindrales bacterium]